MTDRTPRLPMSIAPPDPAPAELTPLLDDAFARGWAREPEAGVGSGVRDRLMGRLTASRAAEAAMVTVRRRWATAEPLVAGVRVSTLYQAADRSALRPGEPLSARLLELNAGARLPVAALGPVAERQGV